MTPRTLLVHSCGITRVTGRTSALPIDVVQPRLPVRHDVVLRAEHLHHPIARVVVPQGHRDGPLQHRRMR